MSKKQTEHGYHYVNSLDEPEEPKELSVELANLREPEEPVIKPEEPVIELVEQIEELKLDDKKEVDIVTFKQFYSFIDEFKKANPTFTSEDYKRLMNSEEFKEEKEGLILDFINEYDLSSKDPRMLDVLICLSSIGIDIPKVYQNVDKDIPIIELIDQNLN